MSAPGRRGAWRWALSIPLAAVLLYYSLRGVDWSRIWGIIAAARWEYIVAASAIVAFNPSSQTAKNGCRRRPFRRAIISSVAPAARMSPSSNCKDTRRK